MNKLNRKTIISIVLLLFLHSAQAEELSKSPIPLGMVAPLTGDFAAYGLHMKHGVELALSDLEEKGIDAKVTYEDACLPTQVRSALSKLISVDRIKGLVGSYCVIGMVASESLVEKAKVVSFQTSGGTAEITNAGEYLFTTAGRTSEEARTLAEYAFNKLALRKAAILYLTTQWGEEFKTAFSDQFVKLGGKITGTATNPIGANDFRSDLTLLRTGNPDNLVIVHLASSLGIAINQARELGFKGQLLTTTDAEEESVVKVAGANAEGLKFFVPEPEVETTQMIEFATKFKSRFQSTPHPLSRHAYDATIIIGTALDGCKQDQECAKKKIYQIRDYSGVSGTFSIDPDGGTKRDFILKEVRGGAFVKSNFQQ